MLILKLADNAYAFAIWIAAGIYKIAAYAFEVFIILATGQVVDSNTYQTVINNFYIVLGIILLFFLAFSLLKGMVNPDDSKKGTSAVKNTIINLVTSVAIMALLPTIFGFLYDFQTSFITRYNVIGRFFGYGSVSNDNLTIDSSSKVFIEQGAYKISNGIFTAFMNVNMDACSATTLDGCQTEIKNKEGVFRTAGELSFTDAINKVNTTGEFRTYDEFSANITDGEVEFHWFLAIIAGLVLVYVAVSFCFDMGIRMVKLVFYQVIAPIPIFGRVIPEGPLKDSFGKWVKLVTTCYLEVYVRIFIFYFAVWLCLALYDAPFLVDMGEFNFLIRLLARAFLLMGIVVFMKQAPKLISDVTGLDSGNMKLGIRDKLKEGGFFTAGAAVGSALTAGTRNLVSGVKNGNSFWKTAGSTIAGIGSGAVRGGHAGWKAGSFADMKNAAGKGAKATVDARNARTDRNTRYKAMIGTESNLINNIAGRATDVWGEFGDWATGGTDRYAGQIKAADAMTSSYDAIEAAGNEIYDKYKNNEGIKARMSQSDFKGDSAKLFALYNRYNGKSMSVMEADLERLRNEDPTRNLQQMHHETPAAFKARAAKVRADHIEEIANMESMISQTKKQTLVRIQAGANGELVEDSDWAGANVGAADAAGVKSAIADFEERFRANGASVVDPIESKNNRSGALSTAADRKAAADAYKNLGNDAKRKSAALRLRAEQRKNDGS